MQQLSQQAPEAALVLALQDRNWRVRDQAMSAFGRCAESGKTSAALEATSKCLKHRRWRTRAAALRTLKRCSSASTTCALAVAGFSDDVVTASKAKDHTSPQNCNLASVAGAMLEAVVHVYPYGRSSLWRSDMEGLVRTAKWVFHNGNARAREVAVDVLAALEEYFGPWLSRRIYELLSVHASNDSDVSVRMAAVSAAVLSVRTDNLPTVYRIISSSLQDVEVSVRCEAVQGLAAILGHAFANNNHTADLLLKCLTDSSVQVRRLASAALHHAGIDSPALVDGVLPLVAHSVDWWLWHAALIGLILSGRSRHEVLSVAAAKQHKSITGVAFARLMTKMPNLQAPAHLYFDDAAISQAIIKSLEDRWCTCLEDRWWRVRRTAVLELSRRVAQGDCNVVERVLANLTHSSSRTRCSALQVLMHVSPLCKPDLASQLADTLEDFSEEVRECAVHAFGSMAKNRAVNLEAVDAVVQRLISSRSINSRRAASEALYAIATSTEASASSSISKAAIADCIIRCTIPYVARALTMETLGQVAPHGHSASIAALHHAVTSNKDPSTRFAALKALEAIAEEGDSRLYNAAEICAEDDDEIVSEEACELLASMKLFRNQRTDEGSHNYLCSPSGHDTPGHYKIIREVDLIVSVNGDMVQTILQSGEFVDVLEVSYLKEKHQVQGRIRDPSSWICLVDMASGTRMAERCEFEEQITQEKFEEQITQESNSSSSLPDLVEVED